MDKVASISAGREYAGGWVWAGGRVWAWRVSRRRRRRRGRRQGSVTPSFLADAQLEQYGGARVKAITMMRRLRVTGIPTQTPPTPHKIFTRTLLSDLMKCNEGNEA
jgi:hypothetical protein